MAGGDRAAQRLLMTLVNTTALRLLEVLGEERGLNAAHVEMSPLELSYNLLADLNALGPPGFS